MNTEVCDGLQILRVKTACTWVKSMHEPSRAFYEVSSFFVLLDTLMISEKLIKLALICK